WSPSVSEFIDWVVINRHRIDCLIVQSSSESIEALRDLKQRDIVLPALSVLSGEDAHVEAQFSDVYHEAVASLDVDDLAGVDEAIRVAVDHYLRLSSLEEESSLTSVNEVDERDKRSFLLSLQQQRLSEKLEERLGYLGVYYKRNPQNFLRQMAAQEQREFLDKLRQDYRHIILNYFANDTAINQKIDDFVNVAFFADMSVPKIVEIHMELIDDFSKQLQLEGRSDEILADYRLTLIDVIAHLCEMYRRSIPRNI
ncbi:MAG: circadian clock protein KaiA, partial [Cyanobacteria bacterium J06649_4]